MIIEIPPILPNWINSSATSSKETFLNYCPYLDKMICQVAIADEKQIDLALKHAKVAQIQWGQTSVQKRALVLQKAAQLLRDNNDQLAKIETQDTGRPWRETSTVDIQSAADCLDYFAALIKVSSSRFIELEDGAFAYTRRRPLGICLGIGAWNYPLQIAVWKAAPALAAGNAFVFKPSELTPISAYFLGFIFKQAGLPGGLFTVLNGEGNIGEMLVKHHLISKVSLTGSTLTGKKIYQNCASSLKKISLELGGKSPLIIFEDADLDSAVQSAMLANFYSAGQICSNGTRIFVHHHIKEKFEQMLVEQTSKIKIGDPMDPQTQLGPLVSKVQKQKVLNYIEVAKNSGAKLLFGGEGFKNNIVGPTIFTNCQDEMSHCKEEIFGPVMSILEFKSTEEVVKRANQTDYGLAAGVFTTNLKLAHYVAQNLQAGICWINNYNLTPVEIPFGGVKQSGFGRENGHEALLEYTQVQTTYVAGNEPISFF